jgi:hypothetical protein
MDMNGVDLTKSAEEEMDKGLFIQPTAMLLGRIH